MKPFTSERIHRWADENNLKVTELDEDHVMVDGKPWDLQRSCHKYGVYTPPEMFMKKRFNIFTAFNIPFDSIYVR